MHPSTSSNDETNRRSCRILGLSPEQPQSNDNSSVNSSLHTFHPEQYIGNIHLATPISQQHNVPHTNTNVLPPQPYSSRGMTPQSHPTSFGTSPHSQPPTAPIIHPHAGSATVLSNPSSRYYSLPHASSASSSQYTPHMPTPASAMPLSLRPNLIPEPNIVYDPESLLQLRPTTMFLSARRPSILCRIMSR